MTPRQGEGRVWAVEGFFIIACLVLLFLLIGRYDTLVLILVGVLLGMSALTFLYARGIALLGFFMFGSVGFLALGVQRYYTLTTVIMGTILGIGTLVFLTYGGRHLWAWWFPDEAFAPTVKRWLRYLLQAVTAALAYVLARFYINELTGVDPGNFPTVLGALTVLGTLTLWLVVLPYVLLFMASVYVLAAGWAGILGKAGQAGIGGLPTRYWYFRAGRRLVRLSSL